MLSMVFYTAPGRKKGHNPTALLTPPPNRATIPDRLQQLGVCCYYVSCGAEEAIPSIERFSGLPLDVALLDQVGVRITLHGAPTLCVLLLVPLAA
jgi:hypothetical protein